MCVRVWCENLARQIEEMIECPVDECVCVFVRSLVRLSVHLCRSLSALEETLVEKCQPVASELFLLGLSVHSTTQIHRKAKARVQDNRN
jgi:hypothetical protein